MNSERRRASRNPHEFLIGCPLRKPDLHSPPAVSDAAAGVARTAAIKASSNAPDHREANAKLEGRRVSVESSRGSEGLQDLQLERCRLPVIRVKRCHRLVAVVRIARRARVSIDHT